MPSLRNRLVMGACLVIAVGLGVAGNIVYMKFRAALYAEWDTALLHKCRTLTALTEFDDDGLEFDWEAADFEEFRSGEQPEYFQLWRADGTVLAKSQSLGAGQLTCPQGTSGKPRYEAVRLADGRRGRQVALTFIPKIDEEFVADEIRPEQIAVTVSVAQGSVFVDAVLARLRWILITAGTTTLAISVGLLFAVVGRGLFPLRRLATEIDRIDVDNLTERFNAQDAPRELIPIVGQLNGLLDRLKHAFERERSFSSDVAHELRTPLAGIRSTMEVCTLRRRSQEEYRAAIRSCLGICKQSQEMVETLLEMSRVERGQAALRVTAVDLVQLINECWKDHEATADERRLGVRGLSHRPTTLETDRDKLRIIVNNLIQNAVCHSDMGGTITIVTATQNGSVSLSIENSGNQLSADQVAHVFDRFWRGEVSRSGSGAHCGLGLSMVHKLVALLGGRIEIAVCGPSFRVDLTFAKRFAHSDVEYLAHRRVYSQRRVGTGV